MKQLSVLRHGKAALYSDYSIDYQRPLAGRGPEDVAQMAHFLAAQEIKPDWIISSPALRARQTTEIVARVLDLAQAISWDERIYDASAETLLAVVQATPEKAAHVLLVGHNPGCADLVAGLCAGTTDRLTLHLPTTGLACLRSQVFYWSQMRWGAAELHLVISPKAVNALGAAAQSAKSAKKAAKKSKKDQR